MDYRYTACVLHQLIWLHSNVPWLIHGRLFWGTLRQRHICCSLFMFRFYSCKLIIVGVYSLIPQAGFLLIRTSVFMILWLTNDNEHIDHFKLNLVLQHKSTPKCPVAPPSILPGYHYSLPLTVNRHSPKCILILSYLLNELSLRLCVSVCLSLSVCVCACVPSIQLSKSARQTRVFYCL